MDEEGEEIYQDQDKREETASVGARIWESRQGQEQDTMMMNGWINEGGYLEHGIMDWGDQVG